MGGNQNSFLKKDCVLFLKKKSTTDGLYVKIGCKHEDLSEGKRL